MQEQEGVITLVVSAKFTLVSVLNIYLQFQEAIIFTYMNMFFTIVTTWDTKYLNRCLVLLVHDAYFYFFW